MQDHARGNVVDDLRAFGARGIRFEQGTLSALLAKDGLYAEMWARQASEQDAVADEDEDTAPAEAAE